jgi:hypothetical protein
MWGLAEGCLGCKHIEPEVTSTIARSGLTLSEAAIKIFDDTIKAIKISQGLCLQVHSLHQRFVAVYFRASPFKELSLMDWTKNAHDGTEVGTIRWVANGGVGGQTGSYINNNFSQQQDYFSPNSSFGGYVTADFNGRIMGFQTTNTGGSAAQMTLSKDLSDRIYDSWGANPTMYFDTPGAGMREIKRGGTYDNNGTTGGRTKLYNGEIDLTGAVATTVRQNMDLNFYSLANNRSTVGSPNGTAIDINTVGYCMFEYMGSYMIRSKPLYEAVDNYLRTIGAVI